MRRYTDALRFIRNASTVKKSLLVLLLF